MHEAKSDISSAATEFDPTGSSPPRPLIVPPPTFWPFVTAVGLGIGFWGVTLNWLVAFVGTAVFLIGMAGFIGDWIREQRSEST